GLLPKRRNKVIAPYTERSRRCDESFDEQPETLSPPSGRGKKRSERTSRPAAPDTAIAPADEFQALLVARPVLEVRKFQILLGGPALAGDAERLHLGGGFLQQAQLVARILLGAEPAVDAGVAGDQPIPVHGDHILDEILGLERIHVDEAAARHR